jgi:transcriptional regulator
MKSDRTQIKIDETSKQSELFDFIKHNSFCTFITCNDNGLFLSHINLIGEDDLFFGHLSAGNPHAKQIKNGAKIVAVFKDTLQQDPNSMAVHLHGSIRMIEDEEELAANMTQLISKYESGRPSPWSIDWSDAKFKTQMKGIVGFNVVPEKVEKATIHAVSSADTSVAADICPYKNMSSPVGGLSTFHSTPIYTPRYFVEKRPEILEEFIGSQKSCIAIVHNNSGSLNVYHANLAVLPKASDKLKLAGRLIISNEQSQVNAGDVLQAIVIFNGPHTYISPTWYETPHSVPTWNYVTAHARGEIKIIDKKVTASDCLLDVEFEVSSIDGKYKLNQNRTLEDREGVISGLGESVCQADQEVGKLMQRFSSNKL